MLIWFLVSLSMHDMLGGPVAIGPFTEEACRRAEEVLSGAASQAACRKAVAFRAEGFGCQMNGPWVRTVPIFEGDPDFAPTARHP